MTKDMQIDELTIRKGERYRTGEEENHYYAVAKVSGTRGNLTIPMTPEVSDRLMEYLAPLIAKFGSEAAQELANLAQASVDRGATVELLEQGKAGA